jgi:hypothetical protein
MTENIGTVYARLMTKLVFDVWAIMYTNRKYPTTGPIKVDTVIRDTFFKENNCVNLFGKYSHI